MKTMTGTLIGNLIYMILDPIFILGFKWGVTGTAVATVIGIGIGSGVQPFLGCCYGAKNKERLTKGIYFSAFFALVFCLQLLFFAIFLPSLPLRYF